MAIRNQNWYNLQATRRYPLDDISTGETDDGKVLNDGILVDCHIRFPSTVGNYLYIQGITVSPGIVTVVFGAAANLSAEQIKTVAFVSVPKPISQSVNYAITGIVPGIAGWVVFGAGTAEDFSGRYSKPEQTLISMRCARKYKALPISSLSKIGLRKKLTGVVNIAASLPLTSLYQETLQTVVIDPISKNEIPAQRAIIIELNQTLKSTEFNPLADFIGPCGQRPESGTCGQEPISSINGIAPDCDGNINIVFENVVGKSFKDCGGIDILTDISLEQSCEPQERKIKDGRDQCVFDLEGNPIAYTVDEAGNFIDESGNIIEPNSNLSVSPIPDIVIEDIVNADYPCVASACLNSCEATAQFNIVSGSFLTDITNGPPAEEKTTYTEEQAGDRYFLALSPGGISVAIFKNCASNWSANKSIRTAFKATSTGPEKNGGIVLNYKANIVNGQSIKTYTAVVLDVQRSLIRVLRFDTYDFIEEHSAAFDAIPGNWYSMQVIPTVTNTGAAVIQIYVTDMLSGVSTTTSAAVSSYGAPDGQIGLFAQNSYSYFSFFEIE